MKVGVYVRRTLDAAADRAAYDALAAAAGGEGWNTVDLCPLVRPRIRRGCRPDQWARLLRLAEARAFDVLLTNPAGLACASRPRAPRCSVIAARMSTLLRVGCGVAFLASGEPPDEEAAPVAALLFTLLGRKPPLAGIVLIPACADAVDAAAKIASFYQGFEDQDRLEALQSAMARSSQLGHQGRPLCAPDMAEVRRLLGEGRSIRQIARELKITRPALRKALARAKNNPLA